MNKSKKTWKIQEPQNLLNTIAIAAHEHTTLKKREIVVTEYFTHD